MPERASAAQQPTRLGRLATFLRWGIGSELLLSFWFFWRAQGQVGQFDPAQLTRLSAPSHLPAKFHFQSRIRGGLFPAKQHDRGSFQRHTWVAYNRVN
jgi:hypothetical protein